MSKEWPTFLLPPELNGGQLEDELKAAGVDATVAVVGEELRVTCKDGECSKVEEVIAAHVPVPDDSSAKIEALKTKLGLTDEDLALLRGSR